MRRFVMIGLLIAVSLPCGFTMDWPVVQPSEQGFDNQKIDNLVIDLKNNQTDGLIIIRNDQIVCEWYSAKLGKNKKHYTASMAKALVGGMSLLLALNDGLMDADDPAEQYIPAWKDDPTREGITIRHLATHSSGVEDAESPDMGHFETGGWKSKFWKRDPDPFTIARDWAPMHFKPGTGFEYSNPGMAMLSYAVTYALQKTEYKDVRTLLRERIMQPIGIPDEDWSVGYRKTYEIDGLGLVANWGGGSYTVRAVAHVGRLMLNKGNWDGKQLVDSKWVEYVTSDAGTPEPYRGRGEGPCPRAGLAWWVNSDGVLDNVPRDAFLGAGAGNQVLMVVPSLNLIVVRMGGSIDPNSFWGGMEQHLFSPLMQSINNRPRRR